MFRDITQLPTDVNCIKIVDDKSLIVYTDTETSIYKLVSNKYYSTETFPVNTPSSETVCYSLQEISELPSIYDFITPVYHLSAILSAMLVFYLAYKLLIYPWFRKKV